MTIPATHAEIERLFISAESNQCQTVCITASNSDEGTSSVAQALCERYLLADYRTLLVDLNLLNPSLVALEIQENAHAAGPSTEASVFPEVPVFSKVSEFPEVLVQTPDSSRVLMGVVAPNSPSTALKIRDQQGLARQIEQWSQHYDRIVFDTSPLLAINKNTIPAPVVARACDGAYLLVLSGSTTTDQVERSISMLSDEHGAQLLGTLINCRDQPTLAQEIVREIDRFSWLPKRWTDWCKAKVLTNHFLSLSI
ncbi:hypothetical protein VHP8226_03687 [Vibrio hippocampi]|uniref:Chromosome partitioning protein ParA n=2 Tax=Vibrio hippocampi TaxID=654686 RepID=A0ABM8ZNT2_9VIBR|nr:hypothetical protein VHP8226_03687 [Vibrio hippocampi]